MTRLILWVAAGLFLAPPLHALDLTPVLSVREVEGFRIPIVTFADGARRVTYQPPANWRLSGGGELLQVIPTATEQASMQLRVSPRPPATEDFERWARSFLAGDATDVIREGECAGQFTIGAQPSRAITFSYRASGRRFRVAMAGVDLNERERLTVIVKALEPDFKAIHEAAIGSLFSWNWSD